MSAITVRPAQPRIGAEIERVDLAKPLSTEVLDAIFRAVLDYGVIFFRDQDITREQHIAFGRSFGKLAPPFVPLEGYPEMLMVKSSGSKPSGAAGARLSVFSPASRWPPSRRVRRKPPRRKIAPPWW